MGNHFFCQENLAKVTLQWSRWTTCLDSLLCSSTLKNGSTANIKSFLHMVLLIGTFLILFCMFWLNQRTMCSEAIPWSNQSMPSIQSTSVSQCSAKVFSESKTRFCSSVYIKLHDQRNSPHFSSKKVISQPSVTQTPQFFPQLQCKPFYFHVRIDLGHIWGPFRAKIEEWENVSKKCFFGWTCSSTYVWIGHKD